MEDVGEKHLCSNPGSKTISLSAAIMTSALGKGEKVLTCEKFMGIRDALSKVEGHASNNVDKKKEMIEGGETSGSSNARAAAAAFLFGPMPGVSSDGQKKVVDDADP